VRKGGHVRLPIGLLCVLLLVVSAARAEAPSDSLGDDPAQFDKKLEAAALHSDTAFLQTVLSDDVRFTHGTGAVWDKHQWLEMVPRYSFIARTLDSVAIEAHGDVIETVGHIHIKPSDPKVAEYHIWYVRVYSRRNGKWQLLSNRTVRQVNGSLSDK
jgi:hypothetical protein